MSSVVVVYEERECEKGKEGKTALLWPCRPGNGVGVGQRVRFLYHRYSGTNGKLEDRTKKNLLKAWVQSH